MSLCFTGDTYYRYRGYTLYYIYEQQSKLLLISVKVVVDLWFLGVDKISFILCFLQSTMPRFSGLVKHKCSQCHRSYTSLKNMRVHETTHSGRYPYWCKVCGKGFQSTSHLRGHMARHTGVAEFKCDICGRQFRYPHHYKRHLKQHSK